MDVNTNEMVQVQLTDFGWTLLHDYYRTLDLDPAPYVQRVRHGSADGWQTFQLWELMEIFGPKIHNGAQPPFERNVIRIRERPPAVSP